MTHASLDAYERLEQSLPRRRREVFKFISYSGKNGATLDEIGKALDRRINSISGRVTELVRAGLVRETLGRRRNQTVWTWTGSGVSEAPKKRRTSSAIKALKEAEDAMLGWAEGRGDLFFDKKEIKDIFQALR